MSVSNDENTGNYLCTHKALLPSLGFHSLSHQLGNHSESPHVGSLVTVTPARLLAAHIGLRHMRAGRQVGAGLGLCISRLLWEGSCCCSSHGEAELMGVLAICSLPGPVAQEAEQAGTQQRFHMPQQRSLHATTEIPNARKKRSHMPTKVPHATTEIPHATAEIPHATTKDHMPQQRSYICHNRDPACHN